MSDMGLVGEGRYRPVAVLGQGGTSTTWEAAVVATGERVALKRMSVRGAESWKVIELFEREARVLANLAHPSIPRFIDAFVEDGADGPTLNLVQERAPGRSLAERLAMGGHLERAEICRVTEALLDVLEYLHGLHPPVIHRDVKPANILVADDGRITLVDFGAVRDRVIDHAAGGSTVAGTYGYMAPEQLRGVAVPATDLYGLGATVLFLATGRLPTDLPQERLRPVLPSAILGDPALETWLRRALAPAPEDRFQSAAEARAALRAGPPRRRRARVVALSLALVTLVGASAVGTLLWERRSRPVVPVAAKRHSASANKDKLLPRPWTDRYHDFAPGPRFDAHLGIVSAIGFSANGAHLVTASHDGSGKLWKTEGHRVVQTLGHRGRVASACFTSQGGSVVTVGDHTVRLWDSTTGAERASFDSGAAQLTTSSLHGSTLAVGSFDGNVRLHDLADGRVIATVAHSPGSGRVHSVAFTPDGKLLATAGDDRVVRVWAAPDYRLLRKHDGNTRAVSGLAISADGTLLASAGDDGSTRLWSLTAGDHVTTFPSIAGEVWSVRFSSDGRFLFTSGLDGEVRVFALPSAKQVDALRMERAKGVASLAVTPDGKHLYVGTQHGVVATFRFPAGATATVPPWRPLPEEPRPTTSHEDGLVHDAAALLRTAYGRRTTIDEAEALLKRVHDKQPRHVGALLRMAEATADRGYRKGDEYDPDALKRARAYLEQASALEPNSPRVMLADGSLALKEANLDRARERALAAQAIDAGSLDAELLLAQHAKREGDPESALRRATSVLEKAATATQQRRAFALLLDAHLALADYDAADLCHQRLIEASPLSPWTLGNYASFQRRRGKTAEAIALVRRAVAISRYGMALRIASDAKADEGAIHLWERGDVQRAREAFEEAIEWQATARAHYGMAAVHRFLAVQNDDPKEHAAMRESLATAMKVDADWKLAGETLAWLDRLDAR